MNFSVLMSLYIKEDPKCLDACFDSIAKQTLPANEIVIIYDGPITTDLEQVVMQWQKKLPLKVYKISENKGLSKALQFGIQHCQFDWIMRMDTDDICVPERFKKQVNYVLKHPETDVCGGQIMEFANHINENDMLARQVPQSHDAILSYAKYRNPINHMTVFYKKEAVIDAGGYQYAPLYEDYDLWIRMLLKGYKFANLDLLVYARTGKGMYQRRGGWQYAKNEVNMQIKFYNLKFINHFQFTRNILVRIPARILPNKLRKTLYEKLLRQ